MGRTTVWTGGTGRWGGRARGSGRAAACALALGAGALPGVLAGQGLEVGAGISQVTNPPAELFDPGNDCPPSRNWAGDGRVALRFSRAVSLEGTGSYNWASNDFCQLSPEPIPPTGPHTASTRDNPGGFPYFATDARLAFEPSSPSGPMWLRAFGGYGVMWGKDARYWLAGAGLVVGAQIRTAIEVEWNWFKLPFEETTLTYQDGTLVSTDITTGRTSHSTFRLRAIFRWSL